MVATSAPAGFPTRPYSALTIGGLFPLTDPGDWSDAALSHQQKAASLLESAEAIRRAADGVPAEGQSGHTVDGFADASHRLAQTVTAHADEYFAMAGAAEEVGRLISGLREDLDNIDREANQEIHRVLSSGGGAFSAAVKVAQLNAIVAQARADATAKTTATAGAIGKESTKLLGSGTSPKTPSAGTNGAGGQPDPSQVLSSPNDTIIGPHSGLSVVPVNSGPHGPVPQAPPGPPPPKAPGDSRPGGWEDPHAQGNPLDGRSMGSGIPGTNSPGSKRPNEWAPPGQQFPAAPPIPVPPGLGSSGVPLSGGGMGMPGMPGGLGGSGGIPSSGLANFSPASGLTSPSSLASSADFSRGLNAGLGAGGAPAAPLMPPVPPSPPSEPVASSGAPS
ncbi:MAG: hypothetical protein JO082_04350, partial [Mycobacterium sp.]|nr:hypothetical protein [Mycobacterium sp.]